MPERVKIRILDEHGKARKGIPYRVECLAGTRHGTTDGDGALSEFIQPDEEAVLLVLECEDGPEEYILNLGRLQPRSERVGAKERLLQLGYWPDYEYDAPDEDRLKVALYAFPTAVELPLSGKLDAATKAALKRVYGS